MNDRSKSLSGYSGLVVLRRFLSLKGIDLPPNLREDASTDYLDADGILLQLRASGIQATRMNIQPEEILYLERPTLVQLKDEGWAILLQRSKDHLLVEHQGEALSQIDCVDLGRLASGTAIDVCKALPESGSFWWRLARSIPVVKQILIHGILASLVVQGLGLIAPQLTRLVVDTAIPQGAPSMLVILALGLLVLSLSQAWVSWLRDQTNLTLMIRLEAMVQRGLFEQILWLPFRTLQKKSRGELLQAFMGLSAVQERVIGQGLTALQDGLLAMVFLVWMISLLPGAGLLVLVVALAISASSILGGYLASRRQLVEIEARSVQRSFLVELLGGVATLKATGTLAWGNTRWMGLFTRERELTLGRERLESRFSILQAGLQSGLTATLLIWGGYSVLHGVLSLGAFLAFLQMSASFLGNVQNLSQTTLVFIALQPQVKEAQSLFAQERTPRPPDTVPSSLPGPVVADGIWFRYDQDAPWVLQNYNLRVGIGQFHLVRGPSGSGKSTLLKVLAGLYTADTGRVSLGGIEPLHAARFMCYLPQFTQLMAGSIKENLDHFSGRASFEEIKGVAQSTGLQDWVDTLPMGYQTMLGVGGSNLSGGQRQLISLTAVLASSRDLLLLDEAMSNLDWVTRQRILTSPYFMNRTVIYASHEELLVASDSRFVSGSYGIIDP